MSRKALVVGVRQIPATEERTTIEQIMLSLGQNTGNMMFTESLLRFVAGATWGSFSLSPQEIEGHDAIILAAANWVNDFDDFGWLADRLERTRLPVFLVGVGAQASNSKEIPKVTEGTLRLLNLVKDRSISISARGTFSCEVLSHYGIKNARPTGCPSLLLMGPEGPQASLMREVSFDACCMHATRHGFRQTDPFQTFLYRQAFSRNIDLVLQSEVADIHYVANELADDIIRTKAEEATAAVYGNEDRVKVANYLSKHGHVFTHYPDWIKYMQQRSFCFGTRIHGTIAALIAGTPATLIVHDSRTAEMADIMGVPRVPCETIPIDGDIDISSLYRKSQMESFSGNFTFYYKNFLAYMSENAILTSENYRLE